MRGCRSKFIILYMGCTNICQMRNPLSAIIQSAELISSLIGNMGQKDDDQKAILDAAEIINLCAQHQKRIVDDLLTLSKLDAKLLVIAHENVDPINIIEKMLQMYQAELRKADITVNLVVDQTLNDMAICEVIFDPGRFLQVRRHLSDSNAQI